MKYIRNFENESDYESFKNGSGWVNPNICDVNGTIKTQPYEPPTLKSVGDIAYLDGNVIKTVKRSEWNNSLGTPFGIVAIPEDFLPDGKARIISLDWANENGGHSDIPVPMRWSELYYADEQLTDTLWLPVISPLSSDSDIQILHPYVIGYLPSDSFSGALSNDNVSRYIFTEEFFKETFYIQSPYKDKDNDKLNNFYYQTFYSSFSESVPGNNIKFLNALGDFDGMKNTTRVLSVTQTHTTVNACNNYSDNVANLKWYLPSIGELGVFFARMNEINETLILLGKQIIDNNTENIYMASSTILPYQSEGVINYFYYYLYHFCGGVSYERDITNQIFVVRPFSILD